MENRIKEVERALTRITGRIVFAKEQYSEQEGRLSRLINQMPDITMITVLDAKGMERVKVAYGEFFMPSDLKNRQSDIGFKAATDKGIYLGPVKFNEQGEPTMMVVVPIQSLIRDRVVGVLEARFTLRSLLDQVAALTVGEAGYVAVVNQEGRYVAHPDQSLVLAGEKYHDLDLLKRMVATDDASQTFIYRDYKGVEVLGAALKASELGWIVVVHEPLSQALVSRETLIRTLVIALAAVLALSLGLGALFMNRMTKPLKLLEEGAVRVGAGDLGQVIPVTSEDEVGPGGAFLQPDGCPA